MHDAPRSFHFTNNITNIKFYLYSRNVAHFAPLCLPIKAKEFLALSICKQKTLTSFYQANDSIANFPLNFLFVSSKNAVTDKDAYYIERPTY